MFIQCIYKTRRPDHPHLPICWYKKFLKGPPRGPVTWNPAWTRPNLCYLYGRGTLLMSQSLWALYRRIKRHQVPNTWAVISIVSYALATVSDWIWLNVSNRILITFSTWSNLRFLFDLTYGFWFDLNQRFYLFWHTFNAFISDLDFIIWVTNESEFAEFHIGQGVFEIIQH